MVYLVLAKVVNGEVPQHVSHDRGVKGIQNHAPEDEKPGRWSISAPMRGVMRLISDQSHLVNSGSL